MDFAEFFRRKCPDVEIRLTTNIVPKNYKVVNLREVLICMFPSKKISQLASQSDIAMVGKILAKYGNESPESIIKKYGRLVEIGISDLILIQSNVGIEGPKHTKLNEPVSVIELDNKRYLLNGNHRTFVKAINGSNSIDAYILGS